MHGEEIVYNKRSSKMLVYNWCSGLTRDLPASLCKVFIGYAKSLSAHVGGLISALNWGFAGLLTGVMPSRDKHGSPLEWDRAAKAGKPIAGAFKLLLAQIVGDWEWLGDSFWLHQSDYRNDAF